MKPFVITLKNEKLKQYNRIALFVIIINLALFIYLGVTTEIKSIRITAIVYIFIIIIVLGIDFFPEKNKNTELYPYKLTLEYIIAFAWLQMGFWWAGVIVVLLGFLYLIARRPLIVYVIKDKINYPSFPNKSFRWPELNNVILKDGLLTIDLKNNRFIQQPVNELKTSVNEAEFNDFCREQLNK